MGQPVKIADELILDARMMSAIQHRSIAGQIEFWANLGEAIEPLLQGNQVLALMRSKAVRPLSMLLETVGSQEGRIRVTEHLKTLPFPRYEPAPGRPGYLLRIAENGSRTVGRFVNRRFVAAD